MYPAGVAAPAAQIACIECDLLLPAPSLAEGERAACPRCRRILMACPKDGFARILAFGSSAVLFLVFSLMFPFLGMRVGGFENQMTLGQAPLELYRNHQQILSFLVLSFILVVPTFIVGAVLAVAAPLARGRSAPWLVGAGRLVFTLGPWSMVEVFVIGVIVSLVKLMAMASIILGISFWCYVAFSVCLTAALSNFDKAWVWDSIERVSQR
jgi:paraquat-inducible protein A